MRPSVPPLARYAVSPVAAVALVGCVLLSGCAGGSDRPSSSVSKARSTAPLPALAHLSAISCKAAADDEWSFTATVTNRDQVTEGYVVKASVVRKADGLVEGSRQMTTELAPGKSTTLTAVRFFIGDPQDLVCVPSVVKKPT